MREALYRRLPVQVRIVKILGQNSAEFFLPSRAYLNNCVRAAQKEKNVYLEKGEM